MTDPLPPLQDPAHPSAWAVAYLDGELSAADRATFEEHLKSHAECREHVETLRVAFPAMVRVLMEDGPPRSGAEYAELAKAAEAKLKSRPSTSLGASGVGRRAPFWIFGGGFAGLAAAAAAAVLVFLQPFTAGLEPELVRAGDLAPENPDENRVPPPMPEKLPLSATLRFGRLDLSAPRTPADGYTSVALVDAAGRSFLLEADGAGPLKLRVALDKLAPGAFYVVVVVAAQPVAGEFRHWLHNQDEGAIRWVGARAYAFVKVER